MLTPGISALRKLLKPLCVFVFVMTFPVFISSFAAAQTAGTIRGHVSDPSGALVPNATLTLSEGERLLTTQSGAEGAYAFLNVPTGRYALTVVAPGFAAFSKEDVLLGSGQTMSLNIVLKIAVEEQQVAVTDQTTGVGVDPNSNANALVLKGSDLDSLSDDPNELLSQLQGLAGPSVGPNGGQLYIDGFTGGQLPPKSSIREIRINQNPFSAEFDRLGYGRIEILTKPGTNQYHARVIENASDSAWNSGNPLIAQQPSYYLSFFDATVSGPLAKNASFSLDVLRYDLQGQSIVNALNPVDAALRISSAVPNPSSQTTIHSGLDIQLGQNNTFLIRHNYVRNVQSGAGIGALNLPEQAYNYNNQESALQIADTIVVNSHLINETRFQWRRIRNGQTPSYSTPTVTLQGAFTTGGNNQGVVQDHQDVFELQNYSTASWGLHTMRFGTRLRLYRDANYSTSGANGSYLFNSVDGYLAKTPSQYQVALIKNPMARALIFDGALFFQDDWRWKPNLTLSYGLRLEGQNRIHDHADWAPRVAVAWAPGHLGKTPPKTVLRAGYGWFYNRFNVPNSFSSTTGTPYVIQAIHKNGVNQQSYVVTNPNFYDPTTQVSAGTVTSAANSIPSFYSIDPNFHAALDMQGGIGVDRSIGKSLTLNVTYLYTRGIHQYRSNNITAPAFDPSTYAVIGPTPTAYNYQFQSGGLYKQHQLIFTADVHLKRVSLHGTYTLNSARSNTQGVNSFPSVANNPSLDYGRPNFDIRNSLMFLGTYSAPYGITFAPLLLAQSGVPYNVTIGSDLTGNNQFNARPTFGICGNKDVLSTPYGCLDTNPVSKGETIIPYGIGTGPANVSLSMRVSKVFGVGPRMQSHASATGGGGGSVSDQGLSGSAGSRMKLDATAPRKYSLRFTAVATNLLNVVDLAPPNGTLLSPLFGQSQSLATGPYANAVPGNRSISLSSTFSF